MSHTIYFDRLTSQIAHKGSCMMVEYQGTSMKITKPCRKAIFLQGESINQGSRLQPIPFFLRLVHWSLSPSVVDTPTTFACMTISLYFTWYLLINFFTNFPGSIPFLESNCGNSSNSQDSLRQPMENHLGGPAISEMKGARLLEAIF